jgi:hypothetical protein
MVDLPHKDEQAPVANKTRQIQNAHMKGQHTYACIMLMYVQQASTAAALITSPCVLAFAFFTLTCNLFLTFINICQNNTLASHPKRNIIGLNKSGTSTIYEIWPDPGQLLLNCIH